MHYNTPMEFHPLVARIKDLLEQNHIWFDYFEHEPVRTSQEAAKIRTGYEIHQGAKALILKSKDFNNNSRFVMLVIPGDLRLNNAKAKQLLKAKDLRFATEQEVFDITNGVQLGGVPPFGNLFGIDVFVAPQVLENEKIIFNAGDKRVSIATKSEDYKSLVNPTIADII